MLFTPLPCHKLSYLLGPPPLPSSVTYFMDGPLGPIVKGSEKTE